MFLICLKKLAAVSPLAPHARGISSVGRAFGWQPKGQGFEPPILHFLIYMWAQSCLGPPRHACRTPEVLFHEAHQATIGTHRKLYHDGRGGKLCRSYGDSTASILLDDGDVEAGLLSPGIPLV